MTKKLPYTIALLVLLLFSLHNTFAQDIVVEAETGVLTGNVKVDTTYKGYSGKGYLGGFQNDSTDTAKITFQVPTAGLYNVAFTYISPYGKKGIDFVVNGVGGSITADSSDKFKLLPAGKFILGAGANLIIIRRGWGYYFLDKITFSPSILPPVVKPSTHLSDTNITCSAQALFNYLVDQYGKKVLTGQQDLRDIHYVDSVVGKSPAVGSFDLIDYSPSRKINGSDPDSLSERAIAWSKSGKGNGIVSVMWHWNAPAALINKAPDSLWWRGFYTGYSTFDLKVALSDTASVWYKLLLSDMDTIALQLKKFQAANVPVLWRPLHEAQGGWFWWGAKGAEPLKQLWRLMFTRFTQVHKLHNLIWVYGGNDNINLDWYPGDAYVDVVGIDAYPGTEKASFSGPWEGLQVNFAGKKLLALTEVGSNSLSKEVLPVPTAARNFGVWWSWFAEWSGDYIRKKSVDSLKTLYNHPDFLTLDELPDWRTIYAPTICLTAVDNAEESNAIMLYPNPAYDYLTVENGNIKEIEILNNLGQSVLTQKTEEGGFNKVYIDPLQSGLYFVKLIQNNNQISVKTFVKSNK